MTQVTPLWSAQSSRQ